MDRFGSEGTFSWGTYDYFYSFIPEYNHLGVKNPEYNPEYDEIVAFDPELGTMAFWDDGGIYDTLGYEDRSVSIRNVPKNNSDYFPVRQEKIFVPAHDETFVYRTCSICGEKYVKCDTNNDGKFGIADAVTLQNWLLGQKTEIDNWKKGDLCEDDKLDVYDLVMMRKMLIEYK